MSPYSRRRARAAVRPHGWLLLMLLFVLLPSHGAEPAHVERLKESGGCPGCDLTEADLRGLDLDGAALAGADLRNAELTDASLRGADLSGADLRGVALHEVNITGADLREADLRHLDADFDLEFVTLIGVRMEGARFKDGVVCGELPDKGGWGCAHD